MKKYICMFLMCWLPLFMTVASAMGMEMALANQQQNTQSASSMPCHQDASQKHPAQHSHICTVCGFCVISGGVAHFNALPSFNAPLVTSAKPLFLEASVHSQTYPPAIKPPILN